MKQSHVIILFVIVLSLALVIQLTDSPAIRQGDYVSLPEAEYYRLVNTQQRFQKLLDLEHEIEQKYYLDPSQLDFDTAIYRGLFSALDKYSSYFTSDEYEAYTANLSGQFVGIGTTIEKYDGVVRVVSLSPGGPAERAGIAMEDVIWRVDQTDLAGLTLEDSANLMRGEAGTPVTIHVRRGEEELSFRLIRAKITSLSVHSKQFDELGYIRISHFEQPTAQQFRDSLRQLRQQNITGLVIDLRSNPGGYLHSVVEIAEQILGRTTIVTEVSRSDQEKVYASRGGNKLDIPFVVLVNKSSASASEILAAAVQDTASGPIIGDVTTGKGVVQTAYRLNDGSGFRITTARYLTTAGRDIHGIGVTPDISLDDIIAAGYSLPDRLVFGADDDAVLNYALDYLKRLAADK